MFRNLKKIVTLLLAVALLAASLPALADGGIGPAITPAPAVTQAPETRQLMAVVKYTNYGRINMRAEPNEFSARIGVLSGGTPVKVLEKSAATRWVLVEGEGKTGYMSSNFLEFYYEGETPPIPLKPEQPVVVTAAPSTSSSYYYTEPVAVASWPITENTLVYVDTANKKSLNLRAGPSTSYAAIRSYAVGTEVHILARRGEWAYVQVGSRLGFMMLEFLSYSRPAPVPTGTYLPPIATVTVTHPWGSFVYLRSSRTTDTNKNILAQIPHGTQVELLVWDYWYSTVRYNGITGYIVTSYLKFDN